MQRRTFSRIAWIAAAVVAATALAGAATDWPQFLGPARNGTYAGPPLADAWGAGGPKVAWRKQVSDGVITSALADAHSVKTINADQ